MGRHAAPPPPDHDIIPWRVRHYLYPILTAAVALLGAYGLVSASTAPLWVALGAAILGTTVATAYTPTDPPTTPPRGAHD